MKFVALALLLVVGSNAASLQPETPSQLQHARAALATYLTQVKESANRAVAQLDDAEYAELKARLSQSIENFHQYITTLQSSVAPVTDSVVATIDEVTADFRTSLMADINLLKEELAPKRAELRDVINKHLEEYRIQLEPLIKAYHEKHTAVMEELRGQAEPVVENLRAKIATNVEETKAALMPILDSVQSKVAVHLENLKNLAGPYVEDYKVQLREAYEQAQTMNEEDLAALKGKIEPIAEEIKAKIVNIFEILSGAFSKS